MKKLNIFLLTVSVMCFFGTFNIVEVNASNSSYVELMSNESDASITSLRPSSGELSPSFNSSTTSYTLNVSSTTDSISFTAVASGCTVTLNGSTNLTQKLNYEKNDVVLVSTNKSGAKKTYTVSVTREDNRDGDATLKSLSVDGYNLNFNKNTYAYNLEVGDAKSVTVRAVTSSSKATITEGLGAHAVTGNNQNIVVKVTAENGTTKQYVITFKTDNASTKSATTNVSKSSNNYLSSLTIEGARLIFDKDTTNYNITVPNSQDKLVLNYTTESNTSTVTVIGSEILLVGNNSICIMVTSEDGQIRKYNLTINRDGEKIVVNNNTEEINNSLNKEGSNVTIELSSEEKATTIDNTTITNVKNAGKNLVFEWYDNANILVASLTIPNAALSTSIKEINPNINKRLTDEKLLEYSEEKDSIIISTVGTNIPTGSIYRYRIEGQYGNYYLYYYEDGELTYKELSLTNGYIEVNLNSEKEYVILKNKIATADERAAMRDFLVPILIIIIMALIFLIVALIVIRKYAVREERVD